MDADTPQGPIVPETVDWQSGVPFSQRYDDRYHTISGARAQAVHVFLGGCGLPEAWSDQPEWTILETGFGLGLSFLSTWTCWLESPRRPACLRFISVEAHPVAGADLASAARQDPALQPLGERLADPWSRALAKAMASARYPDAPGAPKHATDGSPGHQALIETPHLKLQFPGHTPNERLELLVLLGDASTVLEAWHADRGSFRADSIFLDGFDPQQNPAMWSARTLQAVGRHGRPGTRLATWSVARSVRDALQAAGARVQKRPGLPPKRHCLTGILETPPA